MVDTQDAHRQPTNTHNPNRHTIADSHSHIKPFRIDNHANTHTNTHTHRAGSSDSGGDSGGALKPKLPYPKIGDVVQYPGKWEGDRGIGQIRFLQRIQ